MEVKWDFWCKGAKYVSQGIADVEGKVMSSKTRAFGIQPGEYQSLK